MKFQNPAFKANALFDGDQVMVIARDEQDDRHYFVTKEGEVDWGWKHEFVPLNYGNNGMRAL